MWSVAFAAALVPSRGVFQLGWSRGGWRGATGVQLYASAPPVFLTREAGKNAKLQLLLEQRGVPTTELPCIVFEKLPGSKELPALLAAGGLGWVVVTSPEAAGVLAEGWEAAGRPALPIATVGAATAQTLDSLGLSTAFTPSKATGKFLAAELPLEPGRPAVLYPCSALAADTVCDVLSSRGFSVRRLETYTTLAAEWTAAEAAAARSASVVSFGSPSAVRTWHERAGAAATAACIGETSAAEARSLGFARVVAPDSPGVEAWADTIAQLGLWG